mgnify:CR=1 FL=1
MTFNSATNMSYEGWESSYRTLVIRRKEGLDKSPGFLHTHIIAAPSFFFRLVHESNIPSSEYPTMRTKALAKFFRENEERTAIWNSVISDIQLSNFIREGDL